MAVLVEIITYIIVGVIALLVGSLFAWIGVKAKHHKFMKANSQEHIFKKLTENGNQFIDQGKGTHPSRKMIYSLKQDPKTGKKVLDLKEEEIIVKEEPEKVKKEVKKKVKKEVKKKVKKQDPKPVKKAPDYSKVLGTPKTDEEEE